MGRGRGEGGEEKRRCLDNIEWGTDGGERGVRSNSDEDNQNSLNIVEPN